MSWAMGGATASDVFGDCIFKLELQSGFQAAH